MSKRKQVEDYILKYIGKITQGTDNVKLYQELFKSMNNKEFDEFMHKLKDNKITLSVIIPNNSKEVKDKITLENNMKVAKELNIDFFQHLHYKNRKGYPDYKTPEKYLVIKLPIRRVSQLLSKKISVPEDSKSIDLTTGQVTGKSQSSKLTYPEIQLLSGMGLDKSIKELIKYRGGDLGGGNALNVLLQKQGTATDSILEQYSTGVVSTKTYKAYYNAMMIRMQL